MTVCVFCLFHKKMASLTFLKMDLNWNSKLLRFWNIFNSSNWTEIEIRNSWTVTVRWILQVWSYWYYGWNARHNVEMPYFRPGVLVTCVALSSTCINLYIHESQQCELICFALEEWSCPYSTFSRHHEKSRSIFP